MADIPYLDRIRRRRCSSSHSWHCCSHSSTAARHSCHCCNCRTEGRQPLRRRPAPLLNFYAVESVTLLLGELWLCHTPRPPMRLRRQEAGEEWRRRRSRPHTWHCCSHSRTAARHACHRRKRRTEGRQP